MSVTARSGSSSNGRLLQRLAVLHTLVGAAFFRRELGDIGREGVVGAVPYRGAEATAFWFLVPSPLLWILGRLLERAERTGDAAALRSASRGGLISALLAILCLPVSGFWVWLAISLRGLRDARRMES